MFEEPNVPSTQICIKDKYTIIPHSQVEIPKHYLHSLYNQPTAHKYFPTTTSASSHTTKQNTYSIQTTLKQKVIPSLYASRQQASPHLPTSVSYSTKIQTKTDCSPALPFSSTQHHHQHHHQHYHPDFSRWMDYFTDGDDDEYLHYLIFYHHHHHQHHYYPPCHVLCLTLYLALAKQYVKHVYCVRQEQQAVLVTVFLSQTTCRCAFAAPCFNLDLHQTKNGELQLEGVWLEHYSSQQEQL